MTLRKPDEISTLRWIVSGFNFKTLVTAIVLVVSAHYVQSNRITVIEQVAPAIRDRMADIEKRQAEQRDQLQQIRDSKVDLTRYDQDQRRLADDLRAIRDSEGRIETILMQPQFHR
jgi:septal ring factor EnvC (AmiA/AmiB activator)